MQEPDPRSERSVEPCPRCGAHRLALIDFPEVSGVVHPEFAEVLGAPQTGDVTPPAIGCLACGAEWPTLAGLRVESGRGRR